MKFLINAAMTILVSAITFSAWSLLHSQGFQVVDSLLFGLLAVGVFVATGILLLALWFAVLVALLSTKSGREELYKTSRALKAKR